MNEHLTHAAAVARIDLAHEPDFALGRLEVRPSLREIACDGRRETIDRRVMQVLVALARAQGGVVSRDDLIESCWEGVVVGEDAINGCISRLRKAASANGDAFTIETVPRVGYRLKVAKGTTPNSSQPDISVEPAKALRPRRVAAVCAVALIALVAAGIATWHFWPKAPVGPVEESVAVLPFVNMSGDPKQEYFSDGFSEELVNDLSNEPHLNVASRTSSFAFKGKSQDIGIIARALKVRAIVEGSVREFGDRVRITAQLIDGSNGYHLWSAAYDRNLTDILSVQDELARAIASALTHRLVPAPATPHPKIDPAVYRLYLEGFREFNQPPPDGYHRALATFRKITARAPDFSQAFYWLSAAALNLAELDKAHAASYDAIATDAAQRALSLDPLNMHARWVRAEVEIDVWDWHAAALDLRILHTQRPKPYSYFHGLSDYFRAFGFMDEAVATWRDFLAALPLYNANRYMTLDLLSDNGRFQQEIDLGRAMLADQPQDVEVLSTLCSAYAALGRTAEAKSIADRLRRLQSKGSPEADFQGCTWSLDVATGNRTDALRVLNIWESEFPDKGLGAGNIASDFVLLGDFAKASDWFERSYERRESDFFGHLHYADPKQVCASKALSDKAFSEYRLTAGYRALAEKPLFREWQAEHDRIAAALAAHRDPLQ